jgi:signal transduction histidine kinase
MDEGRGRLGLIGVGERIALHGGSFAYDDTDGTFTAIATLPVSRGMP